MTLHIIKLCVGTDSVEDLADWFASGEANWKLAGGKPAVAHKTRMIPKRIDELLDGGSLYWVVHGRVQVRQRLLAVEPITDKDGIKRCAFVMEPALVLTHPRAHRPFQGWRYLEAARAPKDIGPYKRGARRGSETLKAELSELGLI